MDLFDNLISHVVTSAGSIRKEARNGDRTDKKKRKKKRRQREKREEREKKRGPRGQGRYILKVKENGGFNKIHSVSIFVSFSS